MAHFTYVTSSQSLCQGDVIEKNEEIKQIMADVHPHYVKDDYRYFIVLTQSCDLVQRKQNATCKSPYITLAAVRPLDVFLKKEFLQFQQNAFEQTASIINKNSKYKCSQIVEKLLNNNLPDYFYLHEDSSLGFSESCVAFLKLSISIKSSLHYEKCFKAKCLELSDDFKAKLGWNVGQMYSRVGTKDWIPTVVSNKRLFEEAVDSILNLHYKWIDDNKINQYIKNKYQYDNEEDIIRTIESLKCEDVKEIIAKRIFDLAKEGNLLSDEEIISKLISRIISDPVISNYIKK